MSLRRFFIASVAFHLLLLAAFYAATGRTPLPGRESPLFARLVTPEEFFAPAPPVQAPPVKAAPSRMRPLPAPKPGEKMPLSGLPPSPPQAELPQAERPAHTPSSPSREPGYEETAPETAKGEGSSKRYKGAKLPPLKEELLGGRAMKEQIARATRKVPSPKDIIKFDTKEFRYIGYMQRLKEKIEGIWVYPRKAIEKGLYGDLRIKFVIKKDGTLGEAVVVRTSGHPVLDEAALKALREAQPFWPLPEEWGSEGFTVDGHFVYTLYGKYVR